MNFTKDCVANVLLQFKFLSGKFEKESCVFEHCEIRVPFFRRVKTMSLKTSIGSISLNQHRNAVIWIPGTKISKDEGVLKGTIEFENEEEEEEEDDIVAWTIPQHVCPSDWLLQSVEDEEENRTTSKLDNDETSRRGRKNEFDPLCTGSNCYAQIFFKIVGVCLSDIGIDVDGVSVHPVPKKRTRIKVERQMFGIEYLVWNELGDARYIRKWSDDGSSGEHQ